MNSLVLLVLGEISKAFLSAAAELLSQEAYEQLLKPGTEEAFQASISSAIQKYASTGTRLQLAEPLLRNNGLLTHQSIAHEIAKVIHNENEPNITLIANYWKREFDNPPHWRDFEREAQLLIDCIYTELRKRKEFRPFFDSQKLRSIDAAAGQMASTLDTIDSTLSHLLQVMESHFGNLHQNFQYAPNLIRKEIYDFSNFIQDRTLGFTGRNWLFDKIQNFIGKHASGFYFVIGEPGIGKSAIASQLVLQNGYLHHFNIGAQGINRTRTFLRNICAQLIAQYKLDYLEIPETVLDDSGFLTKLLNQVSRKLTEGQKCIIVIDALDEVDPRDLIASASPLNLPIILPAHIYFVITMRPKENIKPYVSADQSELTIKSDSKDNLNDVLDFLQSSISRPAITRFLNNNAIDSSDFIATLLDKSEGNFMYLHYVLRDLDMENQFNLELKQLPVGLINYYHFHWKRMRNTNEEGWFNYKLPVLQSLAVAHEPITIGLITKMSGVANRSMVIQTLLEWREFLSIENVEIDKQMYNGYRLYHSSFYEFIKSLEEISDEKVNLRSAEEQLVRNLLGD